MKNILSTRSRIDVVKNMDVVKKNHVITKKRDLVTIMHYIFLASNAVEDMEYGKSVFEFDGFPIKTFISLDFQLDYQRFCPSEMGPKTARKEVANHDRLERL